MPSLPPYIQSTSVRQVVFVYPVGHKAVPARLFNPTGDFTGFNPKEAQRAFRPDTLGILIFEDRGPTSYTYTAYLVRNGKLDMSRIGFDNKLEPGVKLIREALATEAGQVADPALAGKVEDMLSRVDWYAGMSDDWSVASGGEAYLKKTIGLLKLLPTSVARDLWQKYAPKDFVFPERRASRIASRIAYRHCFNVLTSTTTTMDRTAAKKYRASRAITFKDGVSLTPGEDVEVVYRMGHPMVAELHHGGQVHKGAIVRLYSYLKGYPKPPPISTLEKWSDDGISKTPTGVRTEPDGYGPDNSPSWLLVLGMI